MLLLRGALCGVRGARKMPAGEGLFANSVCKCGATPSDGCGVERRGSGRTLATRVAAMKLHMH